MPREALPSKSDARSEPIPRRKLSKFRKFYRAAVVAHRGRLKRSGKGHPAEGNRPPREVRRSW